METIIKISSQGQIRIPKKITDALGLEKGDYFALDVKNGQVLLKPRKLIDPSQGWYWTKEWQEMETCVDEESKEGHVSPEFRAAEEGLEWLKR